MTNLCVENKNSNLESRKKYTKIELFVVVQNSKLCQKCFTWFCSDPSDSFLRGWLMDSFKLNEKNGQAVVKK